MDYNQQDSQLMMNGSCRFADSSSIVLGQVFRQSITQKQHQLLVSEPSLIPRICSAWHHTT